MFAALGRVVVRNPLKVILAWVVVSVAVVAFSPRLTDADVQRTQQLAQQLSSAGIDRVAATQTAPRPSPPTAASRW